MPMSPEERHSASQIKSRDPINAVSVGNAPGTSGTPTHNETVLDEPAQVFFDEPFFIRIAQSDDIYCYEIMTKLRKNETIDWIRI